MHSESKSLTENIKSFSNWILFHLKYGKKTYNKVAFTVTEYITALTNGAEKPEYWIDKKNKIIYIVISKSACTSIKTALYTLRYGKSPTSNIHSCKEAKKLRYDNLEKVNTEDFFIFTFVRNPISRITSCYNNIFLDTEHIETRGFVYSNYLNGYIKQQDSLTTFVEKILLIPWKYCDRHFVSQYYWIHEKCRLKPDFIGRVENIETDWKHLQNKFPTLPDINHHNSSSNIKQPLSNDLLNDLNAKYKKDLESFGYHSPEP